MIANLPRSVDIQYKPIAGPITYFWEMYKKYMNNTQDVKIMWGKTSEMKVA